MFLHAARRVAAAPIGGARCLGLAADLLQQRAADAALSMVDDQRTWLTGPSVDDPTMSIADPAHDSLGSFKFSLDADLASLRAAPVLSQSWRGPDPFELVQGEILSLADGIKQLLGSDHPVLAAVARYFFDIDSGKKVRPTMVLLMSRAIRAHEASPLVAAAGADAAAAQQQLDAGQRRLAEISEMIHTASLLHDDVIDGADARRGVKSVNREFGNKLAILAGDFLLSRASVSLARLRCVEVVEVMSTVIEHLVKGEVMQMRELRNGFSAFEYYLRKNYYKTGSLMANSCKSAIVLGGHSPAMVDVAFNYGKHLGLAFQLVDDVLDFEGSLGSLGKPALADLKAGLATAPVLFAEQAEPRLSALKKRKFEAPGDVDDALAIVLASDGIDRTKALAAQQAQFAIDAVMELAPSAERDALVALARKIVNRTH